MKGKGGEEGTGDIGRASMARDWCEDALGSCPHCGDALPVAPLPVSGAVLKRRIAHYRRCAKTRDEEGKGCDGGASASDGSCDSCESHCWSECSCGCHMQTSHLGDEVGFRGEGGIRFSGSHRRRPWLDLGCRVHPLFPYPPLAAGPPRSDPDSSSSAGIDADLRGPVLLAAFLVAFLATAPSRSAPDSLPISLLFSTLNVLAADLLLLQLFRAWDASRGGNQLPRPLFALLGLAFLPLLLAKLALGGLASLLRLGGGGAPAAGSAEYLRSLAVEIAVAVQVRSLGGGGGGDGDSLPTPLTEEEALRHLKGDGENSGGYCDGDFPFYDGPRNSGGWVCPACDAPCAAGVKVCIRCGRRATAAGSVSDSKIGRGGPTLTQPLRGRVCIVTGCNTGLGKETAAGLYGLGATVVMACRSCDKAEAAKRDIKARFSSTTSDSDSEPKAACLAGCLDPAIGLHHKKCPNYDGDGDGKCEEEAEDGLPPRRRRRTCEEEANRDRRRFERLEEAEGNLLVEELDLSSLVSVRRFADRIRERFGRVNDKIGQGRRAGGGIHCLVNNAGLNGTGVSEDGFDLRFQVNYLGHFYLSLLLLPGTSPLRKGVRVFVVCQCCGVAGLLCGLRGGVAAWRWYVSF